MKGKTSVIYFSSTGRVKSIAEQFGDMLGGEMDYINLTSRDMQLKHHEVFLKDTKLKLFIAPVYYGRVPSSFAEKIKNHHADKDNAVVMVIYGNRGYDNALHELYTLVKDAGYSVIAAAAIPAEHSLVPKLAAGRPDAKDWEQLADFVNKVKDQIKLEIVPNLNIAAHGVYKNVVTIASMVPKKDKNCTHCGLCAKICPMDAIDTAKFAMAGDVAKCIGCMFCVSKCPQKARNISKFTRYSLWCRLKKFSNRKEPEFFV